MAGEPTLEEQTRLFIEVLNLGSPQPDGTNNVGDLRVSNVVELLADSTDDAFPEDRSNPNLKSVSRRSIQEICDDPSEEICTAPIASE